MRGRRGPDERFEARVAVRIRRCRESDLRAIEWFGWFTAQRTLIESAYQRQTAGEVVMLVAEVQGFPAGQLWIDLTSKASEAVGVLWALRVLPMLQGCGIASRLMAHAERLLITRGFASSEIGAERSNPQARRLYEQLGYRVHGAERHHVTYDTPYGGSNTMDVDEWLLRKSLRARVPLIVRWTIGDVSPEGFEALRLSVWGARRAIGGNARFVVCVNSLPLDVARERAGALPRDTEWLDVSKALWSDIQPYLAENMAEGVAWKFAPLRLDERAHELALDNDCILWKLPRALEEWLRDPETCLIAEDVRPCFGQFAARCGEAPRNSGIRGVPSHFDLGAAILGELRDHAIVLASELDEQGLQVAAISQHAPPKVVSMHDVTICSPFPPHVPHLGDCGAHFVGLNAKSLPWSYYGRPASEVVRQHWHRHRPAICSRIGVSEERMVI